MADMEHSGGEKANASAVEQAQDVPQMTEAEQRQIRVLMVVVVGLGVLLVAGLVVLVATVIMRAGGGERAPMPVEMALPAPPGVQVQDMTLNGNVLALHLVHSHGHEVVVVDVRKGRVLRRLRLVEDGVAAR